jgi:ATP-binding cassette subfamily B multidrug efflux pump
MHRRSFYTEEAKVYDFKLLKRLLSYVKPYRLYLVGAIFLLLLVSLFQLATPYFTKIAIDRYIKAGDLLGLSRLALLFGAVLLFGFIFQFFEIYFISYLGQRVILDLRTRLFSHLGQFPLSFFDENPVGKLMTRVMGDVRELDEFFTSGLITILGDIFTLIGITVILLILNVRLALVAFIVIPILFIAAFIFRSKVRRSFRLLRRLAAKINGFLEETIGGMSIIQLFSREKRRASRFRELTGDYRDNFIKAIFYFAIFFPTVEIISAVAVASIVWYGGGEVLRGMLTIGSLVAFIQYAQRFFFPIRDLSQKYSIIQQAMAAAERFFRLLDTELETPDKKAFTLISSVKGGVDFDSVSFSYRPEELVLRDISFTVNPGEKVALVGATGAGKTSIISLLVRFYQLRQGRILLDGVDIKELPKSFLRREIGVVTQDVFLFSGTIMENIRLGAPDCSTGDIIRVSRDLGVDEFVKRLPKGYHTEVGERGVKLSAGERQLIAFARMMLKDPKIILLDEATSNVDPATETLIQRGIERLAAKRTLIVIAHRLSTIRYVDRIVVIHKGRLVEAGSHKELLSRKGVYYKLYQLQYSDQELPITLGGSEETG